MGRKMKGLKRLAAFGCVAMLVMTAVPADFGRAVSGMVEAQAEENRYTSGFWTYVKHNDGTVGVSAYAGLEDEVSIPSEIDGMTVTAIESEAFYNNQNIGVVNIPKTITKIGYLAFAGSTITSIEVPETVTLWESKYEIRLPSGEYAWDSNDYYGSAAFAECPNLEKVAIKSQTIPNYAFMNCTKLTTVTLGEKTQYIKGRAFKNDTEIKTFDVKSNLMEVGYECFWNCKNMKSILLGNELTTVGYMAFAGSGLTSIEVPDTVTTWGTKYEIRLPSGEYAWDNDDYYGSAAFAECSNLEKVVIKSQTIPNYAFINCTILTTVTLGEKTQYIKGRAFKNDTAIQTFDVKSNLLQVGYECFWNCKKMQSILLGNELTTVGYMAFAGSGLTSIEVPDTVTTWGTKYEIRLPSGEYAWASDDYYANAAFAECLNLEKVVIKSQTIPNYVFMNCTKLTTVTLGEKTQYIRGRAFKNDMEIKTVDVNSELLELGYECFWNCKNMNSFNLGNKLNTIGYMAFAGSGISEITIPASLRTWKTGYELKLPSGARAWESGNYNTNAAFAECPNLTEVNVGYNTISSFLFANSEKVNIRCMEGTSAYNYAVNNGNSYTLYDPIPAESVKFANNQYTMLVGTTLQLYPILTPQNSTDRVSWTIGNTDIVTINNQNIVMAKANGLVSVKCTTDSGKTCTFTINVVASGDITVETEPVKDITLSTVRNLQNVDYTGEPTTQNLKVMFNPCTELVPGLDYDVTYKDNTEIGTATVTITGKGNYIGSFDETYEIREGVSYGDVSGDGNVDIADALMIARYDAGLVGFDSKKLRAADVNKDGESDIADALMIARYDAGLISNFN